jgi:hypothetical protein
MENSMGCGRLHKTQRSDARALGTLCHVVDCTKQTILMNAHGAR